MTTVFIPTQLRSLTGGVERLELEALNVRKVIDELDTQFPGIRERLCIDGELSPSLQVSIDGVMNSRGLAAKVQPESEVHFIPAIGGG